MSKQEYIYEPHSHRGRKKNPNKPVDLERLHRRNGHYDGKIFYSVDKVTYTFVHEGDVIALHFDLEKAVLFFKGHKILSLDAHPNLRAFLSRFKQCLTDNPKTAKFVKPYESVLASLGIAAE